MYAVRNLWIASFAMLLTMAVMQSCTTMGYENVDTTRKAILVADAEIRGANFLLRDLVQRRAIGKVAASETLTRLREAHAANQIALDAITLSGDPVAATGSLAKANTALTLALTLLSQFTTPEAIP